MQTEAVSILISAEDKASAELAKTQAQLAKLDAVRKKEIETLTAERIAMEQGEEAAMAYRLQLQGLDEATAKLIARQKAEVAQLKEVAKNQEKASPLKGTKATVEFAGSVASFAGASEIGSIASQIGGLTEKVSQFGEVSKAGGASALLFKGGLMAAAAAIGFSVGNALGNLIFQTEKFNREAEKATARAGELQQAVMAMNRERFTDQKTDIELIRDPEEKKAAYQALLGDLKKNLVSVEQQTKKSEKEAKQWAEAWQITGDRKGFAQQAEMQAKNDRERLKALQEQAKEIERILGVEAERETIRKRNTELESSKNYVESLREQLALEKASNEERLKLEAKKNAVDGDVAVAEDLLRQIEAQKKLKEEEQKRQQEQERVAQLLKSENERLQEQQILLEKGQQAAQAFRLERQGLAKVEAERIAAQEQRGKIAQLLQTENDKIIEQRLELEKGKEAAQAFRLEKQGLAKADAQRIAKEQTRLEKLKESQAKDKQKPLDEAIKDALSKPLEAFQSRFLTRGPMDDAQRQQLEVMVAMRRGITEQNGTAKDANKKLDSIAKNTDPKNSMQLAVIP